VNSFSNYNSSGSVSSYDSFASGGSGKVKLESLEETMMDQIKLEIEHTDLNAKDEKGNF
jgi:hypothetical protein